MRNYPSQIDATFFNLRDLHGTVAFLNLREAPTMTETLTLVHERVDDIPLLIGLAQKLNLPAVLDRHLGGHHLHQGLSNGWLATVWIAYILSEGDHRKATVQEWVARHTQTLSTLIDQPIRPTDFTDDRLGIVLRRLSPPQTWAGLEADLWRATCDVYALPVERVRLDSTTTYGFHTATDGGLMQRGHSKDHRPDLPQLKLMAAAAEPTGQLLVTAVSPGNAADDPLYLPVIDRVRDLLGQTGLLYAGDCKMAALATRADLVAHGDYYLTPLPMTGQTPEEFQRWIAAVTTGDQVAELLWEGERLLGGGYEFVRPVTAVLGPRTLSWDERVQVIRSRSLAQAQDQALDARLRQAEAAVRGLTPPPGRGRRQFDEEPALEVAIAAVLERYQVTDLLRVQWRRQEQTQTSYIGPGRGGPGRAQRSVTTVRYEITEVEPEPAAIARQRARHGWRVQVTNAPVERMSLTESVTSYRSGWSLERDFHLLKDRPLGISPLWVRCEDQIIGLTLLLTVALRLLTLFEVLVRQGQAQRKEPLRGLYPGQAGRKTDRPTGVRVLGAIARLEMTLTRISGPDGDHWYISPVPQLLERVLEYLDLSPALYRRLAENSG
jgi:transposase